MAIISNQLLEELRQILYEDCQLKLTLREVTEIAITLVGFFETLTKINYQINPTKEAMNHE